MKSLIFGIDFDGTCVAHSFPEIGRDVPNAEFILKRLVERGHKLILFTMRSDSHGRNTLTEAVNWFKQRDISLYGVQHNPTQKIWTNSPKAYVNYYIDDAAIGCPLKFDRKFSDRPFVDWLQVDKSISEKLYDR